MTDAIKWLAAQECEFGDGACMGQDSTKGRQPCWKCIAKWCVDNCADLTEPKSIMAVAVVKVATLEYEVARLRMELGASRLATREVAGMGLVGLDEVERLLMREAELEAENAKYKKALVEIGTESCGEMAGYEMQRFAREVLDDTK